MTATKLVLPAVDVKAILADTLAHGFEFASETVKENGVTYRARIAIVRSVPKFEAAFPGVILAQSDSSSCRVASQKVSRDAQAANRGKLTDQELEVLNVKKFLGMEVATTVVRALIDGQWYDFASQDEATAFVAELQAKAVTA